MSAPYRDLLSQIRLAFELLVAKVLEARHHVPARPPARAHGG